LATRDLGWGANNTSDKSLLGKIRDLDSRIIYAILLISLLIPYVRPLGLPIPISAEINDYWNYIQNVEEGSVVAVELASDPSTIPQLRSAHQITLLELFKKRCKLVFFQMRDDSPPLHEEMIDWVMARLPSDISPVYGEDWVNLGYLVDAESTVAAIASGIKDFVATDAYGNSLSELPMLDNINDGGDFDFVMWNDGSRGIFTYMLRQWQEVYGTPLVVLAVAINKPATLPYLQSGQVVVASFGIDGSAQIEFISGYIGEAIKSTEPGSVAGLSILILLIISNAAFLLQRARGEVT
jgi:hypothetical protein